jgi:arylsulfatase A-like enzyme
MTAIQANPLFAALVACTALCIPAPGSDAEAERRPAQPLDSPKIVPLLPAPNIMLIVVDDLGWTDLSGNATNLGNGSDFFETPHTDGLASKGLSFSGAYSSGPNCAPSRAALMSGLWAARTGVYTVGSPKRGKKEARGLEPAGPQGE